MAARDELPVIPDDAAGQARFQKYLQKGCYHMADKQKVLIVDDDASYLSIVREWLKETYKVYMANSGLQAIKWLAKNKADLILLCSSSA